MDTSGGKLILGHSVMATVYGTRSLKHIRHSNCRPPVVDGLIKNGKISSDTRTNLIRSGTGVELGLGACREGRNRIWRRGYCSILTTPGLELVGRFRPRFNITFSLLRRQHQLQSA
jgi:hypothetical protein